MSFEYERQNADVAGGEGGSFWASYSDLFLMMSVLFLMLYVLAQLRGGAEGVQQRAEQLALKGEVEDLREQLRVYNALKNDQLSNASDNEKQAYDQLMDKLSLLREEANAEKEQLQKQAKENEEKEVALNHYQQMIRNIINTNMLAKTRIARRDDIIKAKEGEIRSKRANIAKLEGTLAERQEQLDQEQAKIQKINQTLSSKIEELRSAQERNEITKKAMDIEIGRLKKQSAKKLAQLQEKEAQLASELNAAQGRLSAASSELGSVKSALIEKEGELGAARTALGRAQGELGDVKGALGKAQGELGAVKGALGKAQGELGATKSALSKAEALANARKDLAARIQKNFEKAGIKAGVDGETGDVTISFGEEYFDTGKADLKDPMKETLKKSVPIYAESLFKDPEVAKKISAVEIVGFASPTYKGRYVDPQSLSPADQKAVSFNLDLSYKRARSIFSYIFDTQKFSFAQQQKLLPLVKVTGRSFLSEGLKGRSVAGGVSQKDFCQKFDCKKAQKVIIRFNLGE